MKKVTFAVIVGNRGCFPGDLAKEGRRNILAVLKDQGYGAVVLSNRDTKFGSVETYRDAKVCAERFTAKSNSIDGIIVTLPNFGDEKGVLEAIKLSNLNVPVLIHAESDEPAKMKISNRRDSFCGKISVCNNLTQAGIPFTPTKSHTVKADSVEFKKDLDDFASICRIVRGLKNARFGAIGARPGAFNTVRCSEKILELSGITVEPIDLSEIFGRANRLRDNDRAVKNKLNAVKKYVSTGIVPETSLLKMAKFGCVVDRWVRENDLNATAVQCWTSIEEFFGIAPCTIMSMMSQSLLPSACEVDVTGALAMYILQLASGLPSVLLDFNNNYGNDPDKCVLFHCSNIPVSFLKSAKMDVQVIMEESTGEGNAFGTVAGRIKPAKMTFLRTTTDDTEGMIIAYVGQGAFTNDKLETFGGYGVVKINNLQALMEYICRMGFEHHVAVGLSEKAAPITEALSTYMGWEIYHHI